MKLRNRDIQKMIFYDLTNYFSSILVLSATAAIQTRGISDDGSNHKLSHVTQGCAVIYWQADLVFD